MNKLSLIFSSVIFTALLFLPGYATAQRDVDPVGEPAVFFCPNGNGVHFDKIIFTINRPVLAGVENQITELKYPLKTELDIKVKDNPETVADLKGKVLSFLGALYVTEDPKQALPPAQIKAAIRNRASINILSVQYAVICDAPSPS